MLDGLQLVDGSLVGWGPELGAIIEDGKDKLEQDLNERLQRSKIGTIILTYSPNEMWKGRFNYESYYPYKDGSCSVVPDLTSHSMHITFSTSTTLILSPHSHPPLKEGKWHLSVVVNSSIIEELVKKEKDNELHKFYIVFENLWQQF